VSKWAIILHIIARIVVLVQGRRIAQDVGITLEVHGFQRAFAMIVASDQGKISV